MAKDPRGYVQPGDRLSIAASQINALNAMMRANTGFGGGPLAGVEPARNIILARNNTGADLPRWGVMKVDGIEIDPAGGDTERRSFEEQPCVVGIVPDEDTGNKFVVAVEPIKAGKIGRVAASGVVACKVVDGTAGTHARPKNGNAEKLELAGDGPAIVLWSVGDWALVRMGGDGGTKVQLAQATGDWTAGTQATLTLVYVDDCGTASPGEETIEAWNRSYDVASGATVVVAQAKNGCWYLVDASSGCISIGGHNLATIEGFDETKTQVLGQEGGCLKWIDTTTCNSSGP